MPTKLWSQEDSCESSCGSEGNPKHIPLFQMQSHSSNRECSSWVTLQFLACTGDLQITARAIWRCGRIKCSLECNIHRNCTKQQNPLGVIPQNVMWTILVESVGLYIQMWRKTQTTNTEPKRTPYFLPLSLYSTTANKQHIFLKTAWGITLSFIWIQSY